MATKPVQNQEFANNKERLAAIKADARARNKSVGLEGITMASDLKPWRRAAFGIPELDAITGGGIPHGNFTTLWGGPGCGKTTAALRLAANAQKEGKLVYYIALEPFDPARAEWAGVNLDEMAVGQFPKAEQSLDTIIQYAQKKLVDVIILDSIHSLAPHAMMENSKGDKSMLDENMGLLARKLSDFFKWSIDPVKRAEVAVLLIGQTRMQIGFISIEALTGGNALHHASKLIIRERRGAKDDAPRQITYPEGKKVETITGFPAVFKLEKVQVPDAKPEQTIIQVPYYFESGYDLPQYIKEENEEIAKATKVSEPSPVEKVSEPIPEVRKNKGGRPRKVSDKALDVIVKKVKES
jgi:RecA/RadA recombinase